MGIKRKLEQMRTDLSSDLNFEGSQNSPAKVEEVNFYTIEVIARLFHIANISHLLYQLENCRSRTEIKKKLVMMDISTGAGSAIRSIFVQLHYEESIEKIRRQFAANSISRVEAEEATREAHALYFRENKRYVLGP